MKSGQGQSKPFSIRFLLVPRYTFDANLVIIARHNELSHGEAAVYRQTDGGNDNPPTAEVAER